MADRIHFAPLVPPDLTRSRSPSPDRPGRPVPRFVAPRPDRPASGTGSGPLTPVVLERETPLAADEPPEHAVRRDLLTYMAEIAEPIYEFASVLSAAVGGEPALETDQLLAVLPRDLPSLKRSGGSEPYGLEEFVRELGRTLGQGGTRDLVAVMEHVLSSHLGRNSRAYRTVPSPAVDEFGNPTGKAGQAATVIDWVEAFDEIFGRDLSARAFGKEHAGKRLGYLMLRPVVAGLVTQGSAKIRSFTGRDFTTEELMYSPDVNVHFCDYLALLKPGVYGALSHTAQRDESGTVVFARLPSRPQMGFGINEKQAAVAFFATQIQRVRPGLLRVASSASHGAGPIRRGPMRLRDRAMYGQGAADESRSTQISRYGTLRFRAE